MSSLAVPGGGRPTALAYYFFLGSAWMFGAAITSHAQARHGYPSRYDGSRSGIEIQRLQDQQTDIERSRSLERPDVAAPGQATPSSSRGTVFPQETPCFLVSRLAWQDVPPPAWLAESAQAVQSDLVMRPGTGKRLHGYVGGDNGGMKAVGKHQVNAGLTLDSPLFLYDQLSAAWNSNADMGNDQAGARSSFLGYSIPFGYWSLFANDSKSSYRQTLAGFDEAIEYGGQSRQIEAGLGFVPYRGADYKGSLSARVYRKWSSNRIDDIDIEVQHRDVVGYELGVEHRQYAGQAFFDVGGGVRSTLPGMSKASGVIIGDPDWNGRTTLLLAKATAHVPFELKNQRFAYQAHWHMQHARTAMTPSDYFVIGHRYAVRGFDGRMTRFAGAKRPMVRAAQRPGKDANRWAAASGRHGATRSPRW